MATEEPIDPQDKQETTPQKGETAAVDFLLQVFCGVANESNLADGAAVTLIVSGAVISGKLIGAGVYFKHHADLFSTSQVNDIADAFRSLESKSTAADADHYNSNFIHLRDVTIWSGSQPISGSFWRGRLSSVAGWTFGSAERTVSKPDLTTPRD